MFFLADILSLALLVAMGYIAMVLLGSLLSLTIH